MRVFILSTAVAAAATASGRDCMRPLQNRRQAGVRWPQVRTGPPPAGTRSEGAGRQSTGGWRSREASGVLLLKQWSEMNGGGCCCRFGYLREGSERCGGNWNAGSPATVHVRAAAPGSCDEAWPGERADRIRARPFNPWIGVHARRAAGWDDQPSGRARGRLRNWEHESSRSRRHHHQPWKWNPIFCPHTTSYRHGFPVLGLEGSLASPSPTQIHGHRIPGFL